MDDRESQREARRRLKQEQPRLFEALEQALEEFDPLGIHDPEVPERQAYAPEVGTILPRLATAESSRQVERILVEELRRWFGPSADRFITQEDRVAEVASAIWAIWRAHR